MSIPQEDTFADVVSKAMRGLVLTDAMVAERAAVSQNEVVALRTGTWNDAVGRAVAAVLSLNSDALSALAAGTSAPPPLAVRGLEAFSTPFDDMLVNSYVVWDPATKHAAAFDTGADCGPMLARIEELGLSLQAFFLTHTHGDHVFDLDRLCEKTGAPAFVNALEPIDGAEPFTTGRAWNLGELQVVSRLTYGHSKGGTTYHITGLEKEIAVVGDALFAGSMGGAKVDYAAALRTNREVIFSLPPDTVLCPGHGPLTTVGWESVWNPFFAKH
jgi:hydroxyacylglutathione hydrolase